MTEKDIRTIFAKNLSDFLAINGFRQADLARQLHVSTATAAKWATGQTIPRIDKIQRIANWLGVRKEDLLSDGGPRTQDYYTDKAARDYADFLHDNPAYKVLFDASRKVRPQDIDFVREMIERLSHD